jgi:drug/metabolite transporter (DMT)-like permease
MVLYITPITAAIAGVIVLGERITAGMLVGTFLIVIGIATINQRAPSVARHE